MLIILDQINDVIYGDIVLSPQEIGKMRTGEMLEGKATFQGKKIYIGVRLQGLWDEDESKE
jgi:hypothetical protein